MKFKNYLFVLGLVGLSNIDLFGADQSPDFFQSIGKIYVVVTVMVIIFLGMTLYLYRMDKRIRLLEKKSQNEEKFGT